MKKLIQGAGLIVALFFFTVSMAAQDRKAEARDPEKMAKLLTENMKTKLALTDDQYKKTYDANLEFITASQGLKSSEEGRAEKAGKLRDLDNARDEKMKTILTDAQFKDFEVMKKENREKLRERKTFRDE